MSHFVQHSRKIPPNNYIIFEDDLIPHQIPGGRAASYELCPLLTYSIGFWGVFRRFQEGSLLMGGWGGGAVLEKGYVGGSFHGGIYHG